MNNSSIKYTAFMNETIIHVLLISVYEIEDEADNGKDYPSAGQEDKDNCHWDSDSHKFLCRYSIVGNKSIYVS